MNYKNEKENLVKRVSLPRILVLIAVSGFLAPFVLAQELVSPNANEGAVSVPMAAEKGGAKPLIIKGNDKTIADPLKPSETKPTQEAPVSLRFEQSPITEVINTVLGEILKLNYVIHQPINGTITLSTNTPIPVDHVVMVLESALQANGVLMAQDARGTFHVGRPEALKGVVASPKRIGNGALPAGYGTVIVPLKNIGATEMAEILKPVASAEAFARVDVLRNLLIMVGTRNQIEGWLDMVATFDVNMLRGMSVAVFPLQYISAKDVDSAMRLLTTSMGGKPDSGGALPGMGALRVLPIERINSVLVVSPRAALIDLAREMIEKIDRPFVSENEQQLFVYRVQNGSAAHLASVLNGVFGGASATASAPKPTSGVAPGLVSATASNSVGGGVAVGVQGANATANNQPASGASSVSIGNNIKAVADERNNSLVIFSTAAEYKKIESSLRRLDVSQAQVLIEASIIEVTLSGDLQYGLQWYFNNADKNSSQGSLNNYQADSGFVGMAGGFAYSISNPLNKLKLFLKAKAEDKLLKVISSPSLMVLDNQTASIQVGNQQPIQTGTITPSVGGSTTSYEYKDTGVKLSVTPSIYSGEVISMVVNQSLSEVATDSGAANSNLPVILNRQISSKVSVKSGETVVLGGLIRSTSSSSDSGVPLLMDIPVLGNLFKGKSKATAKTELLVMITPRVVRTEMDVVDVSTELRERMKSLKTMDKEIDALLPVGGSGIVNSLVSPGVGGQGYGQ